MLISILTLSCIFLLCGCTTERPVVAEQKPVVQATGSGGLKSTVKNWYHWMIDKKPKYVMSDKIRPDDDIGVGVDCSRYLYLVYRWSGVPVRRVTARDMAHGQGNWTGKEIKPDDADELDIMWWTWKHKPERPFGHVGTVLLFKNGMFGVTHASMGRGHIVHDKYEGILVRDLVRVRRLSYH